MSLAEVSVALHSHSTIMSPRLAKLATVVFLVLNCVLWAQNRRSITSATDSSLGGLLGKRSLLSSTVEEVSVFGRWDYQQDRLTFQVCTSFLSSGPAVCSCPSSMPGD